GGLGAIARVDEPRVAVGHRSASAVLLLDASTIPSEAIPSRAQDALTLVARLRSMDEELTPPCCPGRPRPGACCGRRRCGALRAFSSWHGCRRDADDGRDADARGAAHAGRR